MAHVSDDQGIVGNAEEYKVAIGKYGHYSDAWPVGLNTSLRKLSDSIYRSENNRRDPKSSTQIILGDV